MITFIGMLNKNKSITLIKVDLRQKLKITLQTFGELYNIFYVGYYCPLHH